MSRAAPQYTNEEFVHDERFVEPFANRPHTVLGKRLFPYSLWVQCQLEWAQSPFLLNNRAPTPHDLWVAVQCASNPWTPEHYVADLAIPGRLKWLWRMRRFNFPLEIAKFYAYIEDFAIGPKFWPSNKNEQKTRDCDENLELAAFVEWELKWPAGAVWTMPLGQLRWRSALISKFQGSDTPFWTPLDEEEFQAHKARREAGIDARGKEIHAAHPELTAEEARKRAHDEYWTKVRAALAAHQ